MHDVFCDAFSLSIQAKGDTKSYSKLPEKWHAHLDDNRNDFQVSERLLEA